MKKKLLDAYMKTAETFAECSTAIRLHVGAIVVKDDRIISIGYNGTPAGWDNNCEDKIYCDDGDWKEQTDKLHDEWVTFKLVTKKEVIHAEQNAIAKLAKSNESGLGATMFITHAPCLDCAKLVYQSGINTVYYRNSYRNEDGIHFLEKAGVKIGKI